MEWIKKGLIFNTNREYLWNQSHAQVPTVLRINDEVVRIYYCTRDKINRSLTSFIDVNANNPNEILYVHNKPILELGRKGLFDDSGIMPTWLERVDDKIYFYYIGWNTGNTARYRVAHGLAISTDNGVTFTKYSDGPIMDRSTLDPISVSNHSIIRENNVWKMWYMSYIKWEDHNKICEPYYVIKYAESDDGIRWRPTGEICIDINGDFEGGIARPFVLKENGKYKMWYSFRKGENYRTEINNSYRIGYAESVDGIIWQRRDDIVGISISNEGWDSKMIAYPNIYIQNNKKIMLYNGNTFGLSGFGYAELITVNKFKLYKNE